MYFLIISPFLVFVASAASERKFFGKTEKEIENFSQRISANRSLLFSNSSPDSIRFFCYGKGSDTPVVIVEKNATGIVNRKLPTFILIHGWTNNGTTGWIVNCAEKFHQVGQFNVIAVDWSVLAAGDYFSAVKNLKTVGYRIRDFIKQVPFGVDRVQIIAHSLGAHVAAYVGNALGREKVGTIVGLDPAGPLFDWPVLLPFNSRLTFDDATVVQVIHTMVFLTGVTVPSGTIDFYVNRGVDQPGCSNGTIAQNIRCNHNKSYTYYIQTINNSTMYPGLKQCRRLRCRPNIAYMGHNDNKNKFGVYNVTAEGTE